MQAYTPPTRWKPAVRITLEWSKVVGSVTFLLTILLASISITLKLILHKSERYTTVKVYNKYIYTTAINPSLIA